MARPRTYRCEGIVLKSAPVGEGGVIATIYSRERGKLRAMVRGARKPGGKMVGHMEPLCRVDLALAVGKGGLLDTVTQAQTLDVFPGLKSDLDGLAKGIYMAELVDGYGVEGEPNQQIYAHFLEGLRALDSHPSGQMPLRYFELHLLKSSGFMPEIHLCVKCRKELVPGQHRYSPEAGGVLCRECHPPDVRIMELSLRALKALRFMDASSLDAALKLNLEATLDRELREHLAAALKYWLDDDIRSKRFLEHLERSERPGVPA